MLLSFRIIKSQTLTLRQLQTKLQAPVRSHSFFPTRALALLPDLLQIPAASIFQSSLLQVTLPQSYVFPDPLKSGAPLSGRMCLSLDLPNVFSWLDWGYPFWAGIPKIDVPFSVHQNRWHSVDMSLLSLVVLNLICWLRWYLQAKHSLLGDLTWNAS